MSTDEAPGEEQAMQTTTTLHPLSGSEKQVKWAEDIRAQTIGALQTDLARRLALEPAAQQSAAAFLEDAARLICNRQSTQAAWWINQQNRLMGLLHSDLEREAVRVAATYRAYLLTSIPALAAALQRPVRADLERLPLDALSYEEAILLRLVSIRREALALESKRSSSGGELKP